MNDDRTETAAEVISLAMFDIHQLPGDGASYGYFKSRVDRDARRILSALTDAGFIVMPREPLPELVAAFWRSKNDAGSDYDAYRAMIRAAEGER